MLFQVGDKVEVVNEIDVWLGVLNHTETKYEVAAVLPNRLVCCAGHLQHLIFTDGTRASGSWFDPDLVGKPKVWCSSENHGGNFFDDDEY